MEVLRLRGKEDGSGAHTRAEGKELRPDARRGHADTLILDRIKKIKAEIPALPLENRADDYDRKEAVARRTDRSRLLLTQGCDSLPLPLSERCSDIGRFLNKVILGDCRKMLKVIPENSIDLALTSPPYANLRNYGDGVPVVQPHEYVDWILPLLDEIYRVLKPTGSFILNINDRIVNKQRHTYVHELIVRATKTTPLRLYDVYFWNKPTALPNGNSRRLNSVTEYLIHFCKDQNKVKWNMDAVREPYDENTVKRCQSPIGDFKLEVDGKGRPKDRGRRIIQLNEKGKVPSNVFHFPTASAVRGKKHPAAFHPALPSWFIRALTDEGDLVLDFMAGSGTTCVAAKLLHRKYIGIEINPAYRETALKKLQGIEVADQPRKTKKRRREMPPRIVRRGNGDYPIIYRPCRISEVYGQDDARLAIGNCLDKGILPHVLLFHGISGTGKTTIGRIIAMGLNCEKGSGSEPCGKCPSCKSIRRNNSFAYQEFDAAYFSGVEKMRREIQNFWAAPMGGDRYKIIVFDECQRYSKETQAVLLKPMEDYYSEIYFIFCTTDTKKMLLPLRNRCMPFEFKQLQPEEVRRLLCDICENENLEPDSDIIEEIIVEAKGMPRNALFLLQKAVGLRKLVERVEVDGVEALYASFSY